MTTDILRSTLAKIGGAGLALALLVGGALPTAALTAKECSDKYNEAKKAGTLAGKSWNQFRKTECTATAPAAAATAPATDAKATDKKEAPKVTVPSKAAQPAPTQPAAAPTTTPAPAAKSAAAAPAAGGSTTFPTAIAPAYAKEKPAKARMHTCLDQYKANKAAGTLGGLKWIQKSGGYYSECNKRLKGGA